MTAMTDAIRNNYGRLGFRPRSRVIPTWLLGMLGLFSSQVGSLYGSSKILMP
jgi:hypothetical protein